MHPHGPALFKQGAIRFTCEMMRQYDISKLEAASLLFQLGGELLDQVKDEVKESNKKLLTMPPFSLEDCCSTAVIKYVETNKGSPTIPDVDISCLEGHIIKWTGKTWIDATEMYFPQCCKEAIQVRDSFGPSPPKAGAGYAFSCEQLHLIVWNGNAWMKGSEYMEGGS